MRWKLDNVVVSSRCVGRVVGPWLAGVGPEGGCRKAGAGSGAGSFDGCARVLKPDSSSTPTTAAGAALWLYIALKRTLYFGNTAPFLVTVLLGFLITVGVPGTPMLWAQPFLLTFIAGVFADAYESPKGKLAMAAGGAIVLSQAVFCASSLAGLL